MEHKILAPRRKVLELIEEREVIVPMSLVDWFGLTYGGAMSLINRLKKADLIEPLGIERGRYVLSNEGQNRLDFWRRKENVR